MSKIQTEKSIKELEEELFGVTEKWKRAAADYANLEKRIRREKEALICFANIGLIKELLLVLDSLKEAAKKSHDTGFSLILKQFEDILGSEGVVEIKAAGEKFDPLRHEAVEVIQGKADDKVVDVLRIGYKIGDKVIRPAQVRVEKKAPQEEQE